MPVEIFTKQDFEAALPSKNGLPLWGYAGLVKGEHAYHIPVTGTNKRIVIRSSVKADGKSAGTGKDSIRYWVQYYYKKASKWCTLGKGQRTRYTTREPNWQGRLTQGLRDCWELAIQDSRGHGDKFPIPQAPQPPQPSSQVLETTASTVEPIRGSNPSEVSETVNPSDPSGSSEPTTLSDPRKRSDRPRLPLGERVEIITKAEANEPIAQREPDQKREPNEGQAQAIEAPVHAALRCLAGPGSGKCLAPGTPVLLYTGEVLPVEKIKVGMQLMGPDSKRRIVLSLASGREQMYRITPVKGDPYTVNESHVLSLQVSGNRYGGTGTIVNISVPEYLALPKSHRHHLKGWRTGVDFPATGFGPQIEPYFVGLWLGDGGKHRVSVTTVEPEIIQYLEDFADRWGLRLGTESSDPITYNLVNPDYHDRRPKGARGGGFNPVTVLLRGYHLIHNKHIPYVYKYGSRQTRLELLAGLMDSDGYQAGGYYEITQKRKQLADDILFVARSLGFAAYVGEKWVDGTCYWRISISGDVSVIPVKVLRKEAKPRRQVKSVLRTGIKVESVGEGSYYGFTLTGDGLFLLGDFTVTHNTWTLENRVGYLLDHGVKPENLLAVTFSKPMADEMLHRIIARNPSLRGTPAEKQISTIHALCFRILRAEGDRRNVWDKDWLIKKALTPIIEDLWPHAEHRPGWKDVKRWIDIAKFRGLTTSDDLDFYEEALGYRQGSNLHEARRRFDQAAANERSLTFGDMILDVETRLNRDRAFREKWQQHFKWILIDEGQDTTAQAMRILATLAEPQNQMLIVGDADQLLYRFAGATPEANLYQGFEERYLAEAEGIVEKAKQAAKELILGSAGPGTVKLTVNYRSTTAIVEGCNRLIAHNYVDKGGPYEEQYRKDLIAKSDAPDGDPVSYSWFPTIQAESQSVADSIVEHLANGGEPSDIFVGTRTRAQLGYLEGPLVRAQVPFVNITGGSFWTSKHVADVIAYVRLAYTALHGKGDSVAFKRIYNIASNYMTVAWKKSDQYGEYCNHRWLGRKFLGACRESYEGAQYLAGEWRFKAGVSDLVSLIQEIQAEIAHAPNAGEIIRYVLEECYQKWLAHEEGTGEAEATEDGKLDDLATVIDVASRFTEVDAFLAYVDEMVRAAQAVKDKDWNEFVVLSTVHRLKGLERPVVFGPGWAEGVDPETESPRGLLPHTFSLTPPPQTGPLPSGGIGRIEDERCIAFVLISRAKSAVYLSGCAKYRSYKFHPSRFAEELGIVEVPNDDDGDATAEKVERPKTPERANGTESTDTQERATAAVIPVNAERAIEREIPDAEERAGEQVSTVVCERAERGTSTVVDE